MHSVPCRELILFAAVTNDRNAQVASLSLRPLPPVSTALAALPGSLCRAHTVGKEVAVCLCPQGVTDALFGPEQ